MGPETLKVIGDMLQLGGLVAYAAVMTWLFLRERGANQKTTDRLLDDGVKRTEAQVAHTITLGGLKEVIVKASDLIYAGSRRSNRDNREDKE